VLESRLGKGRSRKPYPLMERLRIIWLMEYFQIPQRRLEQTLGVFRSSVRRWLKGFEQGKLGKRSEPQEPVNKTPREIVCACHVATGHTLEHRVRLISRRARAGHDTPVSLNPKRPAIRDLPTCTMKGDQPPLACFSYSC